jgi:hypothetical protein
MAQQRYDHMVLYEILSDSMFQGHPNEQQMDILFDIIRNVDYAHIPNLIHDIQTTRTPNIHAAFRPRTRALRPQQQQQQQQQIPREEPQRITRPTYKTKEVAVSNTVANAQTECAICQEMHVKTDMTCLSACNHSFGNECIKIWMDMCWTRDRKRATCPSCRVEVHDTVRYRVRALPKKKQAPKPEPKPKPKEQEPAEQEPEPKTVIIMPHQLQEIPTYNVTMSRTHILMPHQISTNVDR